MSIQSMMLIMQNKNIEANRILVFVPDEDGSLKPMYLDKRILSGELKL